MPTDRFHRLYTTWCLYAKCVKIPKTNIWNNWRLLTRTSCMRYHSGSNILIRQMTNCTGLFVVVQMALYMNRIIDFDASKTEGKFTVKAGVDSELDISESLTIQQILDTVQYKHTGTRT